jgi:hypothetical protein
MAESLAGLADHGKCKPFWLFEQIIYFLI